MIVLDANYILRYLLDDIHEMFIEAKSIIDNENCLILNEVMAEVVYVLEGPYGIPRETIADILSEFLTLDNLIMFESKIVLIDALGIFGAGRLDFIDCYLCALGSKEYEVKTFDKRLLKCLSIQSTKRL